MSLALAIRACNGLVLAADSRMTRASFTEMATEDVSEKFAQIGRDVGVMTCGFAEPGLRGIQDLHRRFESDRANYAHMTAIVEAAQDSFRNCWAEWCRDGRGEPGGVTFIIGGYDAPRNQLKVVALASDSNFNVQPVVNPAFMAGKWHLAQYFVNRAYFGEMTVDLAAEFAVLLLTVTMTVDQTVGGPIQMARVTAARGFERVYESDMERMRKRNEARMLHLRQAFALSLANLREGVSDQWKAPAASS